MVDFRGQYRQNGRAVPASYFDVDGTLVRTNLVHPTLFYILNQRTPFRSFLKVAETALRAPKLALAEWQDRRIFNEALFMAYRGMSQDRLLMLSDEAFDKVVKPALFPKARDLIKRCKDEGHEVVLVSGALDFVMAHLKDYLGADLVIANRLELKNRVATGRLLRPVVAGPEKAVLIRDHAEAKGHSLRDSFAYSDSYSDVPMLSVVGHPAAVNPDGRLRRLARTYGWPVLNLENPS